MRRIICLSRFPIDPQQLCPARSLDIIADAALQSLALALAVEAGKRKQGTLREAGLKLNPLFEAIIHHIPHPQHPSCSSSYRKPQSGSFQHLRRHNKAYYRPSGLDLAVDRGEGVELSGGVPFVASPGPCNARNNRQHSLWISLWLWSQKVRQ